MVSIVYQKLQFLIRNYLFPKFDIYNYNNLFPPDNAKQIYNIVKLTITIYRQVNNI